ncbi:MAG TPA: hypothetical protein VH092_14280, partial [Urbifossiella sp.]|nr:hypothetical protein [Urbifossiella sp.]
MSQGRRLWLKRALLGLGLAVAAAGTWAALHRTELEVRYATRQLERAATDEERAGWAARLADHGDAARPALVAFVGTGDPAVRAAVLPVVEKQLAERPDGDAMAAALADALLGGFPACDAGGQEAVVALLPALM